MLQNTLTRIHQGRFCLWEFQTNQKHYQTIANRFPRYIITVDSGLTLTLAKQGEPKVTEALNPEGRSICLIPEGRVAVLNPDSLEFGLGTIELVVGPNPNLTTGAFIAVLKLLFCDRRLKIQDCNGKTKFEHIR